MSRLAALAAAACMAMPLAAHAGADDGIFMQLGPRSSHQRTGDADLDRAVAACDRHRVWSNQMYLTNPPRDVPAWESGWSACSGVEDRYDASAAATAQRQAEAKDKADQAFVDQFVGAKP